MVHRLKRMKEILASSVESQLGNLQNVDAKELGEVVDMVKDLEEAIYYCTITKSMEEAEEKEKLVERHHYYGPMYYRDMDRDYGRMYYTEPKDMMYYSGQPRNSQGQYISRRGYSESGDGPLWHKETEFPMNLRDSREGRSPMSRRMYMESKELHKDKAAKIKDLEHYVKELGDDLVEMIEDASPEEKQILEKKMTALTAKIAALNTGNA